LQLKLNLTAIFDFGILFDSLFLKLQSRTHLPPSAIEEDATENADLQKTNSWLFKNLQLVSNDKFDVIFKKKFLRLFLPDALARIYKRFDSHTAASTEKVLKSFFDNGTEFVKQLYTIADKPIQDTWWGGGDTGKGDAADIAADQVAKQCMSLCLIDYFISQKAGFSFVREILLQSDPGDPGCQPRQQKLDCATIIQQPYTNIYFLCSEGVPVAKATTIEAIFTKWLLFCLKKNTKKICGVDRHECMLRNNETNECFDLFPVFLSIFASDTRATRGTD